MIITNSISIRYPARPRRIIVNYSVEFFCTMAFPDFVFLDTKTHIMVDGTLQAYENDRLEKNVRRRKSFKQTN